MSFSAVLWSVLPSAKPYPSTCSWMLRRLVVQLPTTAHRSNQRSTVQRTLRHAVDKHVPSVDPPIDLGNTAAELLPQIRQVKEGAFVSW